MKVLLYGRYGQSPDEIKTHVQNAGLEIISNLFALSPSPSPDVIVTYGGDGSILGAERDFPGVPKLAIKNSDSCLRCVNLPPQQALEALKNHQLTLMEFSKLEANVNGQKLTALNDIVIRNKLLNSALRYEVKINSIRYPLALSPLAVSQSNLSKGLSAIRSVFIGDGLVIATPFGSTGYFYSIARQTFSKSLGIAFNNTHNHNQSPLIVSEDSQIMVKIIRGPAELSADNNPQILTLEDGCEIIIKKSSEVAKIYT